MKKLLFILFFPITVPVYLLIKLFGWVKDSFIPFMQYDVIPFVDEHIISKIKEYAKYKAEQMQKNKNSPKKSAETISSESDLIHLSTENSTDKSHSQKRNKEELEENGCDIDIEVQLQTDGTDFNNQNNDGEQIRPELLMVADPLYSSCDSSKIVGHEAPFSDEEYLLLRLHEAKNQCEILKTNYNCNRFDSQYACAHIYEFWGAKYRLLAIHHFENCTQLLPTANKSEGLSSSNPTFGVYLSLGQLYEKCRDFSKAIRSYQSDIEYNPKDPASYIKISECYRKSNDLDKAISFLENIKLTEYYINPKPFSNFDKIVDEQLADLYKKKERGYVFRPKRDYFDYCDDSASIENICGEYLKTLELRYKGNIDFEEKRGFALTEADELFQQYSVQYDEIEYNKDSKIVSIFTKKWREICRHEFIVLDFETTGLNYKNDRIIEVAAIKYVDGIETDKMVTLVNPLMHIHSDATAINHITDDMVSDAPTERSVIPQLIEFLGDSLIVGHCVSFDLSFLEVAAQRYGYNVKYNYIDTRSVSKKLFKGLPNYKLGTIAESLHINTGTLHRAEADVRVCAEIISIALNSLIDE